MSSSSQSARRSSSTSYTAGIPGSQVTISINKSGERSLTLLRGPNPNSKTSSSVHVPAPVPERKFPDGWVGPANTPFCKVCYDAGLPVADYTNHFVKDQPGPAGKVVCPTLLAQKCFMCGVAGHTSSYCPEEARREADRKEREREARRTSEWKVVGGGGVGAKLSAPPTPAAASVAGVVAPAAASRNSFGLLAVDSGDESEREREEEEVRNTPAGVPKPVLKERPILTGPPPAIEPAKPLTWAQRAAAVATKTPSSSSSSAASSIQSSPLVDTRFQLHHTLCHNIPVSQRGSSAKKAATTTPTPNHRENAAAVARESSNKRKQESITIPA
jgi:hypothetical protein